MLTRVLSRAARLAPSLLPAAAPPPATTCRTLASLAASRTTTTAPLLSPPPPAVSLAPSAGMKWVAKPKKRCRCCYFEIIDEIEYVFCTKHPRHRQGTIRGRQNPRRILTHATSMSSTCEEGRGKREMPTQQSFRLDY